MPEIAQSIGDIVPVLKPSLIPQLLSIYYEPDALGIQEQTGDTGSLGPYPHAVYTVVGGKCLKDETYI